MAGIINSRQYSVREFTGNFEDAHKFNSLRELFKFARRSREYGTDKMKTRHIVFTYDSIQKCENGELKNSLKFQAIVMHNSLSYLEKKSLVTNTLNSSDNDAVTIHFPNLASWKYIENIKYIIDDLTSTNIYILQKVVVLVAHYSNSDLEKEVKETPSSSINFGDSTWSMHAIDNLSRSEPKRYFETMMMTPLQYIEAKSMSDQIFRNIVSSNFVDYLDNFPDLQEEENIDDYEKIIEVMQNNRALLQMLKNNLLRIIDTRQEACFQNSFYSQIGQRHLQFQLRSSVDDMIEDFFESNLKSYIMAMFDMINGVAFFSNRVKLETEYKISRKDELLLQIENQDKDLSETHLNLVEVEKKAQSTSGRPIAKNSRGFNSNSIILDKEFIKEIYFKLYKMMHVSTTTPYTISEVEEKIMSLT